MVGCLVGWLPDVPARCFDNCTCFFPETEFADQMCFITLSRYIDTGPTSPRTDPITPGNLHDSTRKKGPWGERTSSSSSASPATSQGFIVLLLRLRPQLHLRASSFFFFVCVPSYISGLHRSSSSSAFPATSQGFIVLLLRLRSQLYLRASSFFFFVCVPSYISGLHRSSSSSAFPAISLNFTIVLLSSQLGFWGSPFFFFCVPR